jgi:uncharacterized membrane protein
MNDLADLERGYRRVLMCYPKAFRQDSEQEILGVLLATAREGQRRIGLAESAALVRGGLRMRLRLTARPPRAVRGAVRLMCLGALVEVAAVVTMAVTAGQVQTAYARQPGSTAAQWHQVASLLTFKEVSGGVAVALWLFLAWAIGHHRDVARFGFSAFFALVTMLLLVALAQHAAAYAPADLIAGSAIWLVCLATMVLIFTRQSNAYFRQPARPPLAPAAG